MAVVLLAAGGEIMELVPAHMGDFEAVIIQRQGDNFAFDPVEAPCDAVFQAAGGEELHSDADSEEWG